MSAVSSRQWELRRGNSAGQVECWNQHVMTFSLTQMCQSRDVSDRDADIFEVGRTSAADAVESIDGHLEQCPLTYWQPAKLVAKNRRDVLIGLLARADDQTGQQRSELSAADE